MIEISDDDRALETQKEQKVKNSNKKYDALPKVSHFDGNSSVAFTCGLCRLPAHQQMKKQERICIPCARFQIIQNISNTFGKYSLAALLLGLTIFFIDSFKDFSILLPFLGIVFLIPLIVSSKQVQMLIYRDIPDSNKIPHMLRYYTMLKYNENYFLDAAEDIVKNDLQVNTQQRHIILYYLVEYVLLNNKPKSSAFISDWADSFHTDEKQLIEEMMVHTNFMDAFHFHKGIGVLPEIWSFIKKDIEIRDIILDKLETASKSLNEANNLEKQYFLEDMYLIEEDLIEIIEREQKWFKIDDVLVEFEPEKPPANFMEQFQATAQAQEQARQLNGDK